MIIGQTMTVNSLDLLMRRLETKPKRANFHGMANTWNYFGTEGIKRMKV